MSKKSNKKIIICLVVMILIVSSFLVVFTKKEYKESTITYADNDVPSYIAILLEDGYESNNYVESSKNSWPSENEYTYNSEKSYCDNGSLIAYDSFLRTASVTMKGSDRCHLYFDKVESSLVSTIKDLATTTADNTDWKVEYIGDGYRYRGAKAENYVWFDCDDVNNPSATTCKSFRIIGTFEKDIDMNGDDVIDFKDEITKLIASKAYGSNSYKYSEGGYLNMKAYTDLNGDTFYNTLSTKGKNMIVSTTYNTGNIESFALTADEMYETEQTLEVVNTKVGLMLPSDFGYSIYKYSGNCKTTTVLSASYCNSNHSYLHNVSSLMIVGTNSSQNSIYQYSTYGYLMSGTGNFYAYPVIYLRSGTKIVSGDGTSSSPYVLDYDYKTNYDYFANVENSNNCVKTENDLTDAEDDYDYTECSILHNEKGLRFRGPSSEINNYVCIGIDNKTDCLSSTANKYQYLYRIIGVIPTDYASSDSLTDTDKKDYLIKVVKGYTIKTAGTTTSITLAYASSNQGADFKDSTLANYLNDTYYNSIADYHRSLIAKAKFYTGMLNLNDTIEEAYLHERNNTTLLGNDNRFIGYIGTVYATDKAYATTDTYISREASIKSTASTSYYTFIPVTASYLMSGDETYSTDTIKKQLYTTTTFATQGTQTTTAYLPTGAKQMLPAFYLLPTATIVSGTGTVSDPYILSSN